MTRSRVATGVFMAAALHGLFAAPPAPPRELSLPARLRAVMTIVNAVDDRTRATREAVGDLLGMPSSKPSPTTPRVQFPTTQAIVSITIRRFSLEEEQETLRAAVESGGVAAAMKAMKGLPTLGEVHVDSARLPIRAAVTWLTGQAQHIRLVFSSPLVVPKQDSFPPTSRALDILDLSLPHAEVHGTGSLVTATKVEVARPGLFTPVLFAIDTATQPLSRVERLPAEPADGTNPGS